jgi:hypothetical protein
VASKLEQLVASGELARIAKTVRTRAELARAIGITELSYKSQQKRASKKGKPIPSIAELKATPISDPQSAAYEPPAKWPSVAAFDAAPDDDIPPAPVMPDGHRLRGVSSLVGPDGELKAQWIKTSAVNDERADWLDAIRDMGGELPRAEPSNAPEHAAEDLLAVIPVGDPHVGLLSWHEDAGENFDLDIAERRLIAAFDHLLALSPPAAECLLVFIGDTSHADGQSNTTTKGTRVDVDGRIVKVARTILRICRYAIAAALRRHQRVTIIMERGNHDELISAMLALALAQHYEHEPRVTVDESPAMFHWYRFGANLIGTHHGDKVKPMDLLGVMAVDQSAIWGECKHRRFYLGHLHHQMVKEVPGLICEYLPTLATSDAWHHSMGYRSARALYLDVFHREHGHINRHIVGIDQLRGAA